MSSSISNETFRSPETSKNPVKTGKSRIAQFCNMKNRPLVAKPYSDQAELIRGRFFAGVQAPFFSSTGTRLAFKGIRVCSGGLFESPPGVPDFQWDRLAPIPLLLNSLLTQGPRSGCFYGSSEGLKESSSKLTSIASSTTQDFSLSFLSHPASSQAVPKFAEANKRQRSISTIDICNHTRTMSAMLELFGYPTADGCQCPEFGIDFH